MKMGFANVNCSESEISGEFISSSSIRATTVKFVGCGSYAVQTIKPGVFEIKWLEGTHNGMIRSGWGTEIRIPFGSTACTYAPFFGEGDVVNGGSAPTITVGGFGMAKISGGPLCANPSILEGSYEIVSPKPLFIEKE
jgi:hypothetical protein